MIDLIADMLAVFRLTRLLNKDTILDEARHRFDAATIAEHPKLYELAHCPWCLGMWLAAGVIGLRMAQPRLWSPIAKMLACSAVAGLLSESSS